MHNRLPESVLKRPKQAYRAPIAGSFLSSPARDYVMDLLSEQGITPNRFILITVRSEINRQDCHPVKWSPKWRIWPWPELYPRRLLYHQYILKDSFRPQAVPLRNCRIIHEQNPIYS